MHRKIIVFDDKEVKQEGEEEIIHNFEASYSRHNLAVCMLRDSQPVKSEQLSLVNWEGSGRKQISLAKKNKIKKFSD